MVAKKSLQIILISIGFLLLILLVAMQFTNQVNWSPLDFLIMGILLFGTGLVIDFARRKVKENEHRMLVIVAIVVIFLLIWAELAVGIFGTPFAGS